MKSKVLIVVICILCAVLIVTSTTTVGAGSTNNGAQLREINNRLKRIEKQQMHDSIEYMEILDNGINVVYADGTSVFWGDHRTNK